ncbi:MAG TPA: threonine--tRNA ligase [Solirubrobacteraceae bacterium]|nr:threonine--tRNA ligase [Solirubrobacteraceae bacterium]
MDAPDHRRLGRQLEIFATEEQCGAGLPFWLPAGAIVRSELEAFVTELERRHGYRHVNTPVMAKRELYERSGHWEHYHADMYPPMEVGAEQLVLRPMLCPHHILIFDQQPRSWRELPLRLGEVGPMFRRERSGVVGGLSRVRQSTLNDGHVFCPEDRVTGEIIDILSMIEIAYRALRIPAPRLRLSRGGSGPKYVSDPAIWQRSEAMLRDALDRAGATYAEAENEAAFYGPKIDLQVSDPQGREETLSTIQVDLVLPSRFGLHYDRNGERRSPIMIHRSIIGTLERMTAHLLEVHNGALPVWLSPTQALVMAATESSRTYAAAVNRRLLSSGLRAELDDRDATLGARIRTAYPRKIPYVVVVGEREQRDQTISLRLRDGGQQQSLTIDRLIEMARCAGRPNRAGASGTVR